jgi:pullulanase
MSDQPLFHKAYWTSLNTGVACFRKDWNRARPPELFWGDDKLPLKDVKPAPLSWYGNQSGYFKDGTTYCFMVACDRFSHSDFSSAGVYLAGSFNQWSEAAGSDQWRLEKSEIDGMDCLTLRVPKSKLGRKEKIEFKFINGDGKWLEVPDDAPNMVLDAGGNRNYLLIPERTGRHQFFFTTPLSYAQSHDRRLYYKDGDYVEYSPMQAGVFLREMRTDLPLGARVEGSHTAFRLFAPRASGVRLYLFEALDADEPEAIQLELVDGMVWEAKLEGNLQGWFYYYRISGDSSEQFTHFDPQFRVLDPYALAVRGPLGPCIVVDHNDLPRPVRRFEPPAWHDLVIVEAHVRDLLAKAPVDLEDSERLRFKGLSHWLRHPDCYLRKLGVNAVELQPVHEFDTKDPEQYAWGYMPVNYFAPASQYATNPAKASQIREFAELVESFHDAGLAVILDVVYNHVGEPNDLQFIDKQYYFLLDEHGDYLNYSGCGNTLDANAAMVRHLMVESLKHWIEVFDVDGFRFDLGELIGVDALSYVEAELKKVKPSIVLIAEPWSFRGHIAGDLRRTGFASWNDGYREFVKDYVLGNGSADRLSYFMRGCLDSLTRFPAQTVNYTESHDDRCWIDKITENADHNGSWPTATDRRRSHLMAAILLASVGIPMLSSGADMLKSKQGVNNTYLRGDLNALDYQRAASFSSTHDYFRAWIRFRLSESGKLLRLDAAPYNGYFRTFSDRSALIIEFNADRSLGKDRLIFAVNPHFEEVRIVDEELDLTGFRQIADHERFADEGASLDSAVVDCGKGFLRLPPLACGLWLNKQC